MFQIELSATLTIHARYYSNNGYNSSKTVQIWTVDNFVLRGVNLLKIQKSKHFALLNINFPFT